MQVLAEASGRVIEREEIYQRVWGYAMAHGDRSVDVFVRKLRAKLAAALARLGVHPHALRRRLPVRARAADHGGRARPAAGARAGPSSRQRPDRRDHRRSPRSRTSVRAGSAGSLPFYIVTTSDVTSFGSSGATCARKRTGGGHRRVQEASVHTKTQKETQAVISKQWLFAAGASAVLAFGVAACGQTTVTTAGRAAAAAATSPARSPSTARRRCSRSPRRRPSSSTRRTRTSTSPSAPPAPAAGSRSSAPVRPTSPTPRARSSPRRRSSATKGGVKYSEFQVANDGISVVTNPASARSAA